MLASSESPLPGITPDEYTKLLLSVGRTNKARRPLSPVEVGELLLKVQESGVSTKSMTAHLDMTDTSMPRKFIKLVDLDDSIQYLVTWGASEQKALGFSVAAQFARLDPAYHLKFAEKCLANRITKDESISVIQLLERSGQSLDECVERVVKRRPRVRALEVIIGSVSSQAVVSYLSDMSQLDRDELLVAVVKNSYPMADNYSAKLGARRFTIVGGKSVKGLMSVDPLFGTKICDGLEHSMQGNLNSE